MTVIFDMDGTLVDSSILLANSINNARKIVGLEPLNYEFICKNISNPYVDFAQVFYNSFEITQDIHKGFRDYFVNNYQNELKLFDGVKELLDKLKENNFKIALATNAYRETTLKSIKFLGIDSCFHIVVTAQDVQNIKPAPDMLLKSIQELKSKKAVFVGDSDNDKLAAKAAKLPFLHVDFENNGGVISSIDKLAKEIEAIF